MKKLLLFILLSLCLAFQANAFQASTWSSGESAATDYTQDANCMGAWFMNNNGGSETDRSGEGGTLTQNGGTIPTNANVPSGYSGTSRLFAAADSETLYEADGGSTDINGVPDASISICFWLDPVSDTGGNEFFVSKYLPGGDHRQFAVYNDHTNSVMAFLISSNGAATAVTRADSDPHADTNWHHWCAVSDGAKQVIYRDGYDDTTTEGSSTAGIADKDSPFVIGDQVIAGTIDPIDGYLDEVIIFNDALTPAEVLDIYTNGIDGTKGGND